MAARSPPMTGGHNMFPIKVRIAVADCDGGYFTVSRRHPIILKSVVELISSWPSTKRVDVEGHGMVPFVRHASRVACWETSHTN